MIIVPAAGKIGSFPTSDSYSRPGMSCHAPRQSFLSTYAWKHQRLETGECTPRRRHGPGDVEWRSLPEQALQQLIRQLQLRPARSPNASWVSFRRSRSALIRRPSKICTSRASILVPPPRLFWEQTRGIPGENKPFIHPTLSNPNREICGQADRRLPQTREGR
jgi:hypothetical protein